MARTKILAWGCDRCDFRVSLHGRTAAPCPPRLRRARLVEAGDDEMLHIPVWRMVCQPERVLLPRHGPGSSSDGNPPA